ncbi:uroporphyrinogen decarboxylase/cobalamine-independent methonine synthase family protein [Thalassoroseus pseudoceratinae]|uniref:hypothetical protein n=1 Tax=Thalassoroseus pseudoceratinae TaxID=2713176 RepID=UPI00141D94DC|nr:hypothetical protein [Thalassoroseus pseudoceratinae]
MPKPAEGSPWKWGVGADVTAPTASDPTLGRGLFTQPEQQLRHRVEALLNAGEIESAVKLMSAHKRDDFPPHWDPPPRIGYGETKPELLAVVEALIVLNPKGWVEEQYWEKFHGRTSQGYGFRYYWRRLDQERWDRHLEILENLPENATILTDQREALLSLLSEGADNSSMTDSQQDRLRQLLGVEKKESKEEPAETSAPDDSAALEENAP